MVLDLAAIRFRIMQNRLALSSCIQQPPLNRLEISPQHPDCQRLQTGTALGNHAPSESLLMLSGGRGMLHP